MNNPARRPRPAGRPAKTDPAPDRSQALLEASIAIIAEAGFEGLRTRTVAARAGVNIATLHYYFPSKEALIGAVARCLAQRFTQLHAPRAAVSPGAAGRLEQEFADIRFYFSHHRELILVFEELGRRARRDGSMRKILHPLRWHWRENIADLIRSGQKERIFRRGIDPTAGADLFLAAVSGAYANAQFPSDLDPVLRELEKWLKP